MLGHGEGYWRRYTKPYDYNSCWISLYGSVGRKALVTVYFVAHIHIWQDRLITRPSHHDGFTYSVFFIIYIYTYIFCLMYIITLKDEGDTCDWIPINTTLNLRYIWPISINLLHWRWVKCMIDLFGFGAYLNILIRLFEQNWILMYNH